MVISMCVCVMEYWLLRRADDHDVQPVPRVSEEGEFSHTEASGHDLYDGIKSVDSHKHASVKRNKIFHYNKIKKLYFIWRLLWTFNKKQSFSPVSQSSILSGTDETNQWQVKSWIYNIESSGFYLTNEHCSLWRVCPFQTLCFISWGQSRNFRQRSKFFVV